MWAGGLDYDEFLEQFRFVEGQPRNFLAELQKRGKIGGDTAVLVEPTTSISIAAMPWELLI